MYITQLEIDNFKSFGKKTKIPFFEGFTVVSGPNGTGKSNIIDSILFTLALSGARGLRAEKLTDLINVNNGKNSAEVTLTFSDGTTIRRRIKKTQNGYYSYNYLNDRLCKQSDVLLFLEKHGIKPEGYNVVMQGDITRIMEMSNLERRRIIDEIAGVAEFDHRRDKSLSELEIVRERIEREELILLELNHRLGELETEREQALVYKKCQEEVDFFRSCLGAARLRDRKKELEALTKLIRGFDNDLEVIKRKRESAEANLSELNDQLKEIEETIILKTGDEYRQLIEKIEEQKGSIRVAEDTIGRLNDERQKLDGSINDNFLNIRRSVSRIEELTSDIRNFTIDRSNIAMEQVSLKERIGTLDARLESASKENKENKDRLFELMGRLEGIKERRSAILQEQNILIEKSRMRTSEHERLSSRIEQIGGEVSEKESMVDEYSGSIDEREIERSRIDRELSGAEGTLFAHRSSLERVRKEIQEHERTIMNLEAQQQARGGVGGRALEAILEMDGVYGTVAQLGRAPPDYANALNTAAGGRLNYVIVSDDQVAADAITFLKENRLGRVTFLPLNKIKPVVLPEVNDKRVISYAVDLLEFDKKFERAFRLVFGGTVVIEKMDIARKMLGKYRMVTLEGEILEKSGAMTGGSHSKRQQHGFGVAVEDEMAVHMAALEELRTDAVDFENTISSLAGQADGLRKRRNTLNDEISRFRLLNEEYGRRLESLADEYNALKSALKRMVEEVSESERSLASLEEELEKVTNEMEHVSGEIDSIKKLLDETGIPELTEDLDRIRKELEGVENRLRNKDSDITDGQRERQHFQNRIAEFEEERTSMEEKSASIEVEIKERIQLIEDCRSAIKELEMRQNEYSAIVGGLQKEKEVTTGKIKESERRLIELDSENEKIKLQLSALKEKNDGLISEIEDLQNAAGDVETDLSLEEIESGIARAEREIKRIGAVNMLAIDEYERVSGRISEREVKKDTLSRERSTLIERIEKFEKMKYEAFISAYRPIDENFRKIFARLTDGSGHLILDNEEDPFDGGLGFAVQPRDKKVKLISALSGGEKSLTTLAFIFSIQQYMPAPFYALDEVDMFLDGSNVERIAMMIKELSSDAQSVIVSLRKPMIERADRIIGVTIRPDKSTYVTGVKNNG